MKMKKSCLALIVFFCFFTSFSQTEKNIIDFYIGFYESFYNLSHEVKVKKPESVTGSILHPSQTNEISTAERFARTASPVSAKNKELLITSFFGPRDDRMHYGVDIICAFNLDTIYAVWDGYAQAHIDLGKSTSYGNYIVIKHGQDYETLYAHLKVIASKLYNGSEVKKGEAIGIMGNSGCYKCGKHLHFEIKHRGIPINPVNEDKLLFLNTFPIKK